PVLQIDRRLPDADGVLNRRRSDRTDVEPAGCSEQLFEVGERHQDATLMSRAASDAPVCAKRTSRTGAGSTFVTSIHCSHPRASVATGPRYAAASLVTPDGTKSPRSRRTVSVTRSAIN